GKMDRKKLVTMYNESTEQRTNESESLPLPDVADIESTVHNLLSKQHSHRSLPRFEADEDLIEHTDSLGFINMILELEKKFAITIKDWKEVTRLDRLVQEIMKARGTSIGRPTKVIHDVDRVSDNAQKIQRGLQSVI